MSEFRGPLDELNVEFEAQIAHQYGLHPRTEYFPLFLHFGSRALELCRENGYKQRGRRTAATWVAQIPVDNGVRLIVEAATSHLRVPAGSDRGPLIKDVRLPRLKPSVFEIAIRSETEFKRAQEFDTFVEVGDRNYLRTNIPALQDDWASAVMYVGNCLEANTTREMPEALRDWYAQARQTELS